MKASFSGLFQQHRHRIALRRTCGRTYLEVREHPVAVLHQGVGHEHQLGLPPQVVVAILRLWEGRDAFCDALERLPQTFCHVDAIRRNLLSGAEETVAIDWECAGHYAVGEEVGQTLSVASAFYDVEPADLPALDEALFASYLAGLRDVGWRGDPTQVRFAYVAHAALRNVFNDVGASVPDDWRRAAALENYGRTWEELAERRAAIRPFLLDRADEARRLMEAL